MQTRNRPLSPHLQIYRWEWTMAYSILHRLSGIALSAGFVLFAGWLIALASGPEAFATAQFLAESLIGRLCIFAWSWALFYHLGNGIRHLFWDMGIGYELNTAAISGHCVLAFSIIMTLLCWLIGFIGPF